MKQACNILLLSVVGIYEHRVVVWLDRTLFYPNKNFNVTN